MRHHLHVLQVIRGSDVYQDPPLCSIAWGVPFCPDSRHLLSIPTVMAPAQDKGQCPLWSSANAGEVHAVFCWDLGGDVDIEDPVQAESEPSLCFHGVVPSGSTLKEKTWCHSGSRSSVN
jgi:hypothetical protein